MNVLEALNGRDDRGAVATGGRQDESLGPLVHHFEVCVLSGLETASWGRSDLEDGPVSLLVGPRLMPLTSMDRLRL